LPVRGRIVRQNGCCRLVVVFARLPIVVLAQRNRAVKPGDLRA
jgi:hypothetical protein